MLVDAHVEGAVHGLDLVLLVLDLHSSGKRRGVRDEQGVRG